ncbi:hypothetical protein ACIQGZ_07990, partial [Streptomyces sp. NPDC092296]|uniref:hypothetical protein n=1 Tax=Streptomyces sp. NPDC092296 TaxID=3366012 RepID=UPI0037FC825A
PHLDPDPAPPKLTVGDSAATADADGPRFDPAALFGTAHAACGLVSVAAAALALQHRALPRAHAPALPLDAGTAEVRCSVLGAPVARVRLAAGAARPWAAQPAPRLHLYSGRDRQQVLAALAAGREGADGPARLAVVVTADRLDERRAAAGRWLAGEGIRPPGTAWRERPLTGGTAFVFTNGSAAYPGMGRELALALPDLLDGVEAATGVHRSLLSGPGANGSWASGPGARGPGASGPGASGSWASGPGARGPGASGPGASGPGARGPGARGPGASGPGASGPGAVLDQIMGVGLVIGLHTALSRILLGTPDAAIGYSSGETAALVALGAWPDAAAHPAECRASGLFDREIGGEYRTVRRAWRRAGVQGSRWAGYQVSMPADRVRAALAGEPAVHLMAVNAPGLCVVGGEAEACTRWVARQAAHAVPIDYHLAAHCPELAEVRDRWWQLHHRPTVAVPGVRFYGCASGEPYEPTADRVADALTAQALGTIDYVRVIERAWADGVRVFVEHGPRGLCSSWIGRILGDREHLAVALDGAEGRGPAQVGQAVAELAAAGVPVDADAFFDRWAAGAARPTPAGRRIGIPLLPAEVALPAPGPADSVPVPLPRAPELPPVLGPAPVAVPGTALATTPYPPAPPPPDPDPTPTPPPTLAIAQTHNQNPATPPPPDPGPAPAPRTAVAIAQARDRVTAVHRAALADRAAARQRFAAERAEAQRRFLLTRAAALAALSGRTGPATQATQAAPVAAARPYPGPAFDRAQLEFLAHGPVSALFGPEFAAQDARPRQTRLPRPPLLLVDRVLGIDAEPAVLAGGAAAATGTIWTETDLRPDAWYLDATGRMPAGLLVEAGQADLLLISWLGADLVGAARGDDRVYRLLGCELTLHGSPPAPGGTLRYRIRIDGHAEHRGVRLFFFQYDCHLGDELLLTVRNGQAGFFTDAELADSQGVRWEPGAAPPDPAAPVDPPLLTPAASRFGPEQLRALADGRPADCFGPAWEATRAHVRTPRITGGRMLLLDEVTRLDPAGGPWGRGYLRAETRVAADDWYFDGHFQHDPCMPGTLMFEGALQAMSCFLAAGGHTVDRDGWRFEPVPGRTAALRCRRQVTPGAGRLVYEVFVSEVRAAPEPTVVADVLCSVDGVQAFHAAGVALRLVPDWPLDQWRRLGPVRTQTDGVPVPLARLGGLVGHRDRAECAVLGGVRAGYATLLAAAWGRPSEALGARLAAFDGPRKVARLPGPPYHFVSRFTEAEVVLGGERAGSRLVTEYDVPERAWYFEQNGSPAMPFAVLMEIALQPCGCLAAQSTDLLRGDRDLFFRNLDGTGTVLGEVTPQTRTVRTEAVLRRVARHGDLVIETFDVECLADGEPVFRLSAVFGFFTEEALRGQRGLPRAESGPGLPGGRAAVLDGLLRRDRVGATPPPGPMLLMLDRVTGYWPDGGAAGLGRLLAEKDVDAGAWYFRAHFFQDPVQPGSLGIEAMCQLLQLYLVGSGRTAALAAPRFEPVLPGREVEWRYRGQIVPGDGTMTVELEIREAGSDAGQCHAVADAWLWVDGRCIYQVRGLGMRAVATGAAALPAALPAAFPAVVETVLDPAEDGWLLDHRPGWTVATMPMTAMADRLARAAAEHTGLPVAGLAEVQLRRWLPVDEPVRLRTEVRPAPEGAAVTLSAWREAATPELSRFEPVAEGVVLLGPPGPRPEPFAPLADAVAAADPYDSGAMFHGPAFQYATSLRLSGAGASSVLDAGRGRVPRGLLHQGLLDAALHGLPCQELGRWSPGIGGDQVAVPHRLVRLDAYEPLPDAGPVQAEVRFAGPARDDPQLPCFDVQLQVAGRVAVAMRLVCVLLRLTVFEAVPIPERRAFLRDRRYVPGVGLSEEAGGGTVLRAEAVDRLDLVPGMISRLYGLPRGGSPVDRTALIAAKEHVGRLAEVHPCRVEVAGDLRGARVAGRPGRWPIAVVQRGGVVTVRSAD